LESARASAGSFVSHHEGCVYDPKGEGGGKTSYSRPPATAPPCSPRQSIRTDARTWSSGHPGRSCTPAGYLAGARWGRIR
jgi:hypothetical protein